jgi:PKD repeat protein
VDLNGRYTDLGDQVTVSLTCKFQVITPVISSIVGGVIDVSASSVFPVTTAMTATGGGSGGGGGCIAPSPAIYASATSGDVPLTVEFRDFSGGGAGESWLWDFGDTTMSTNQDPGDHMYVAEGVYVVTLTVTNACGTVTTDPGTTITVGGAAPAPLCTVPEFVAQGGTKRSLAQGVWSAAGFTTTVQGPMTNSQGKDYKIRSQDLTGATDVPCDSTIVVGP